MQSLQSGAVLSKNQFLPVSGNVKTKPPTYKPSSKAIEVNKNFLLISKCFENLTLWEFLMLVRDVSLSPPKEIP